MGEVTDLSNRSVQLKTCPDITHLAELKVSSGHARADFLIDKDTHTFWGNELLFFFFFFFLKQISDCSFFFFCHTFSI